jgi:hypothetical protein
VRNLHNLESLALTIEITRRHRVRLGRATHKTQIRSTTMHTSHDLSSKYNTRKFTTQMELKSLTQRSECVGAESGCFRIFSECLDDSSIRLGVPFIATRQLGAVGGQQGRLSLPFVEWCTGQSGAPPDSHCSLSSARFLSKSGRADHCSFGPDGTPDTVRCTPDSPVHPADH